MKATLKKDSKMEHCMNGDTYEGDFKHDKRQGNEKRGKESHYNII